MTLNEVICERCGLFHNECTRITNHADRPKSFCPGCSFDKYVINEPSTTYTEAKQTTGKLDLTTVPPAIIESVAKVREHAINGKYKDPENWRKVPWEEYWRAMLRHVLAMMRDPMSYDDESGLLHLEHVACNVAFILEMWKGESR